MDNHPVFMPLDQRDVRRLYDHVYRQRKIQQPEALTMEFWEKHHCAREACKSEELSGRVLDYGCGSGEIDILLARSGRNVTGYDISHVALEYANEHLRAEESVVRQRVSFVAGDGRTLPFDDATFDSVLCNHTLEHIEHPTPALKEITRVLKPGGALLLTVPEDLAYYDYTHVRFYTAETLSDLLGDYFDEVEVTRQTERKQLRAVCRYRTTKRLPRIIAQMRIRNEERWIKEVLDSIARVADGIVIVDDGSTDRTPDICKIHPAVLDYHYQNEPVQDQVRDKNRHLRMAMAFKPDWILSLDGDEVLETSAARRIFDAIGSCPLDVSALRLDFLYMWNDLRHYRTDGPYQRIFHARLFKLAGQDAANLTFTPTHFKGNGHCKSVPGNLTGREQDIDVKVLHLGYMYPDVRMQRYERYRQRDPQEFARGDYAHLLDQPGQVLTEWKERPLRAAAATQQCARTPVKHPQIAAEVKQEVKPEYYYANARRNLIDRIPASARRVLDVGCGQGMTGGLLRSERGIEVVGLEIHEGVAEEARKHLSRVVVGDLETMDLPFEEGYFDAMLMGDVLEHLTNPWLGLKKLTRYLNPGGVLVVSIPNVRNLGVIGKLLEGSWAYEEWGILDKTHLRFFALKDMRALFEQAGIEAEVVEVVRDPLFEQTMKTPPEKTGDVDLGGLLLRQVSPRDLDELTAQQFIFMGKLKHAAPNQPKTIPEVSVIIPVFNNLAYTRQCVTSLFATKEKTGFEVIVVDDGSTDGTAEYLRQLNGIVRAVTMPVNSGFAKSCNAGAAAATGQYLVFLNNDTMVLPGWLDAMVDCLKANVDAGLVGNLQIFPDTGRVQQAGIVCGANGMVRSIYNNELAADHPAVNRMREFQFVAGSCITISGELFRKVEGFDEQYLNSCEDVDLCMKVREAGKKVLYCPASKIYHFESKTVTGHDKNSRNYQRFLARWGGKLVQDDYRYLTADGLVEQMKVAQEQVVLTESPAAPQTTSNPETEQAKEKMMTETPRVAILTTYNQYCGLSIYAESLVAGLREHGVEPLVLAEKDVALRGAEEPGVLRCWTRDDDGGGEVPEILKREGIQVLHINYGGIFPIFGWIRTVASLARRQGVRVVTTFHTTESMEGALGGLARLSDRVLTHHSQNEIELVALGAAPDRTETIPLGMQRVRKTDLIESKLALGWDPARKTIGTFGFVEPHKGILEVIEAFKTVYDHMGAELRVFGGAHPDNPDSAGYLTTCKQRAAELGMADAVHFGAGFVQDADVQKYLQGCDVLVMNYRSTRFEGSAATMQALSTGRPVIASAAPTFDYPAAIVFRTTEEFHLANAMLFVLQNPLVKVTLARNVAEYERIAAWDVVSGRVAGLYKTVVADAPKSETDLLHYYRTHPDEIYAEPLQRERVRWLKSKAVGRILEIGPANGYVSEFVGAAAAVDIYRGRLEIAQALRPDVKFQYGDVVEGLPFRDKEFDVVMAPEILEHVDFDLAVKALRECARVARRILITIPNADKPDYEPDLVHNIEHRWLVNRPAVERLLSEAGCTDWELDTSEGLDFYLLDIRTDSTKPRMRIHERAAMVSAQAEELNLDRNLHLAIDTGALDDPMSRTRGIGRYTLQHLNALIEARPDWTYSLRGEHSNPASAEVASLCSKRHVNYQSWNDGGLSDVDVFYLTHPMGYQGSALMEAVMNLPTFIGCTFYDLAPLVMADAYLKPNPDLAAQYTDQIRRLQQRCDLFLCTSQSVAQDLQVHVQMPQGRLRMIHGGAPQDFSVGPDAATRDAVLNKLGLRSQQYLLSVGMPEQKKNITAIFLAFQQAKQTLRGDWKLVLAGEVPAGLIQPMQELAERCGVRDDLMLAGYVPEGELNALYHGAAALLHPSMYEGFGFPIMEAMQAGLPVIAGNNTAQTEISGNAAVLVDPRRVESIAQAVVQVCTQENLRKDMSARGRQQAQRYSWQKTAEKTAVYLAEAVAQRNRRLAKKQTARRTAAV